MDNLNIEMNKLNINTHIPYWVKKMSYKEIEHTINLIYNSDKNNLFKKISVELCENTRNLYELELVKFLEKLQNY